MSSMRRRSSLSSSCFFASSSSSLRSSNSFSFCCILCATTACKSMRLRGGSSESVGVGSPVAAAPAVVLFLNLLSAAALMASPAFLLSISIAFAFAFAPFSCSFSTSFSRHISAMSSSNWCRSVYTSSAPDLQESKQGENCPFNYTMLFAISFFIPLHSIELVSLISTPLFVLSFSAWLQQQSFCTSTAAIQIPR